MRAGAQRKKSAKEFVQKSFPMGAERLFHREKALATAERIEDEELSRHLNWKNPLD